jgi:thiamine-monophosphate kinase
MPDEYEIIKAITSHQDRLPRGYGPIGDDVALVPVGKEERARKVVLKCDMLVERTDVPPGMGWRRAVRKAVAMCVSDFAAKGVSPTAFMVSLGLPAGTPKEQIDALAAGLSDASKEWRIRLIGGDTNEADMLVVDCVMVGFATKIVRRDTARAGEYVFTTGTFGKTAAGLKILLDDAEAEPRFREEAISSVYLPTPNLRVGTAIARYISSSIDSSDGLAISLHSIAEMSGVGIALKKLPYARGLEKFAASDSYTAEDLALYGGEEYEIVGTVSKKNFPKAAEEARSLGCELIIIGKTTKAKGIALPDGRLIEKKGWVHLK